MRAYHNSRDITYRDPFGAVKMNGAVSLCIDLWDETEAQVTLRMWVDEKGEELIPMQRTDMEDRVRFSVSLHCDEPAILWYSFIINLKDGSVVRYGAIQGRTGGEGMLYSWEPPSFQITVYHERTVPDWYLNGIVYQIFPDRFFRGEDWQKLTQSALSRKREGPDRKIVDSWTETPFYLKDDTGHIKQWTFYGGTLSGIQEKLMYLKELGVTALYLNPIFCAASNHRYDTADYMHVDEMLGGDVAFETLIREAEKLGISIILDGVFNHTGCDSIYFDKYRNYGGTGAYCNESSDYRSWYHFDNSPVGYDCWWGVDDLPNVEESDISYQNFIYGEKDSVVRHWLRQGVKGWRLDVADELPDTFIQGIKKAVLEEKPNDGLVIGEVWEDASNKISYGKLRKYLLGEELDSVMNYPLRDAIHSFLLGRISAVDICEKLISLQENYPSQAFYAALNLMGSHDRPRILTLMGEPADEGTMSDDQKQKYRLSKNQRGLAKGRLWLMTLLQMTMPGVPCIYYGDEAGMEGFSDPYNRGPFPWGNEDSDMATIYRNAICLRRLYPVLVTGSFTPFSSGDDVLGYYRNNEDNRMAVLVNRSLYTSHTVRIHAYSSEACELISGKPVSIMEDTAEITLWPMGSAVIHFLPENSLSKKMKPGSGVLCHITSLPNKQGFGKIGKDAMKFIDFLASTGQHYWQILPLNPTDEHGSPYAGASAFAGNIALLPESEQELRKNFKVFQKNKIYNDFCTLNKHWLLPYAAFTALSKYFGGKKWSEWPKKYQKWDYSVLDNEETKQEAEFVIYCQYRFHVLWKEVRSYASDKGISIIGDIPMYVSDNSSDAWAYPELFTIDSHGHKTSCAGVPPDYFSKDGQLWGNPLFNWNKMKENDYDWWMHRFQRAFDLYDFTRLDHFRGFESYWSVPEGRKAAEGKWLFGPGMELFIRAYDRFGPLPVLAEDLGVITPAVRGLVAQCGFLGTDVIQFYDTNPLDGYTPPSNKIAYTGTHDNQTLVSWCATQYPDKNPATMAWQLMQMTMQSSAEIVIFPLQDVLGLDDEARMNTPGTTGTNWQWQAKEEQLLQCVERFRKMTLEAKR